MTLLMLVIDFYHTNLSRVHKWLSALSGQLEMLGFFPNEF